MSDPDETDPIVAELPDIIGSAAGAAFGLVLAGPSGAIAGAASGPAVAAALRYGADALHARRQRAGRALQVAADELSMTPDDLGDRATQDPARLELLARVLEASGRSTLADKIPALGRVLAVGLGHTGKVDEALILAAALSDLEAPHVHVLDLLAQRVAGPSVPDYAGNPVGWLEHELADALPGYRLVLPTILHTIELHGLTKNTALGTWEQTHGQTRYALSALGEQCLALLNDS